MENTNIVGPLPDQRQRETDGHADHATTTDLPFRVLDKINTPVVYITRDYRYKYVSRAYAELYNTDQASITGVKAENFLGPKAFAYLKPYIDEALSGRVVHYEQEVPFRESTRFIEATYTPDIDENGNVLGYVALLKDISAQKNAEKELKASHAYYEKVLTALPVAVYTCDKDGCITFFNDVAVNLWGYTPDTHDQSLKFCACYRVWLNGTYVPPSQTPMAIALETGQSFRNVEAVIEKPGGEKFHAIINIDPLLDKDGNICGAVNIFQDISHYKIAEESRAGLAAIVQFSEDAIISKTTGGIITSWNPAAEKLYGYSAEEMIGKPISLLIPPELINEEPGILERIKKGERVDPYETRRMTKHGRLIDVSLTVSPIKDSFGNVIGASNIAHDISVQKLQKEQLIESISLFQTMADNVPAMIWMSGTDTSTDYFNKTWLEFTGRTSEEEGNEGWLAGVHLSDMKTCIETYHNALKQQEGFYLEYRLRRHDGQFRWIANHTTPRFGPVGDFLGFISACVDIDDQKRFREKIQDSELLFKTISNTSPTALWMTDKDKNTLFVNDTWLKWTAGVFSEHVNAGWLSALFPEDRDKVFRSFAACFEQGKNFIAEFRIAGEDGNIRWCLSEGKPYFDINGIFAGYAGSVTDITEIKKLERRKDDFIKMASHELKTPITSINGYVQLLLNIYNETEADKIPTTTSTVKSSLATIAKQVTKLSRLVSELLDLSKIDSGKLELNCVDFNFNELVDEVVQDTRLTASRHAILLENNLPVKVYGDKDRLGQVLMNILNNAIKYSPQGGEVELSIEKEKHALLIRIKDEGIGIDKKEHRKIFERFYRVDGKAEQTFPGFGIGLFIADEIVCRHRGAIFIKSEKGKGAIFTICLPLDFRHETNR